MGKSFGQITSYVLQDIFEWLASPAKGVSEEKELDLKVSPTRHRQISAIEQVSDVWIVDLEQIDFDSINC